jgi:hypothetical protein
VGSFKWIKWFVARSNVEKYRTTAPTLAPWLYFIQQRVLLLVLMLPIHIPSLFLNVTARVS